MADATRGFSTFTVEDPTYTLSNGNTIAIDQHARLSISSRELLRKCFIETSSICLPEGHSTIALNEEQISCVLKAVVDETAKSPFDMLNSVVTRASQLSLGRTTSAPKQQIHRPFSTFSATSASVAEFVSDGEVTLARSETTRGLQSDEELWGSERSREHSESSVNTRVLVHKR